MNKGEIRTRVLEQVDWQPDQSTSFKDKIDRMIDRAYQQLSLEAPFLFFEDSCRIITQPDAGHGTSTEDRLYSLSTDARLLRRSVTTSLVGSTVTTWKFDRTWDGRMIDIERADGKVYRRQIRTVNQVSTGSTDVDEIVLETPWEFADTDTDSPPLKYRIYTPEYELPADVIELRSSRVFGDTHYELTVRNQHDMERYDYLDYRGDQAGRPTSLFRGEHKQIDAPMVPPNATLKDANVSTFKWVGPDSPGAFEYCYTYVWGKRDTELQAPNGIYEPKWESAPSPISQKITQIDGSPGKIEISLPNIHHALDDSYEYDGTSAPSRHDRYRQPSVRCRVYVRRTDHYNSAHVKVHPLEDGVFYLLGEVDGGASATPALIQFHHNGQIPEYRRRLKDVHGYQTIRFHPHPDDRYEIDCRVLRKPQKLVNDQDAPRVHPEAVEALIQKIISMVRHMEGAADLAEIADKHYRDMIQTLTKRYGMIPRNRPTKKFARVARPFRETRVKYTETS